MSVVISGIGMVTPLGHSVGEVLRRLRGGESAAATPRSFDPGGFPCRACAEVRDFEPERFIPEPKSIRMMNRDAQLAVAAARLAMADAGVAAGTQYPAEHVGLFGATGMAGLPLAEVARLIQNSAADDGSLDLHRFGDVALRQVRPVLSFRILSNIPMCFVSIFEGIKGANAVYNPWEGQGAHAIAAGARAVKRGSARCVLVGGCDVKTHELGFVALRQCGALRQGSIPGEGAAFLVLEDEGAANRRGARILARLRSVALATGRRPGIDRPGGRCAVVGAEELPGGSTDEIRPKARIGNLYAAAAAVQVAIAAGLVAEGSADCAVAECFGFGSEQGVFVLERP